MKIHKTLLATFIPLVSNGSYSQIISGTIVDSISKKPIELATISLSTSNYTVLSNKAGHFEIDHRKDKGNLQVSNIGYNTKSIVLSDKEDYYLVYLSPKTEELKEVIIISNNKPKNYSPDKFLKSKRDHEEDFGFQFDTENCVFILNPYHKKGKIKSLDLELKKVKGYNENNKNKIDYLAAFNIKFYSYDSHKNKPGKEIHNKNIIIEPENKTYTLKIDLDSLQIPFPENGVCVGVEIINTKYKNPKMTFAYIGPFLNFYENRQFSPTTSWTRYRNYENDFITSTDQDYKGKKYKTIIVDLTVKLEE
jgi:hypothetical protein